MGSFLLFRSGDRMACSFIEHGATPLPSEMQLGNRRYCRKEQIPLFDHLLTAERELAGFCLHALDYTPTLKMSRLLTASNVFDDTPNWEQFAIVLNGQTPTELHNDCCACLAAEVYFDGTDEHIIVVPDSWSHHWNGLAFPMVEITHACSPENLE